MCHLFLIIGVAYLGYGFYDGTNTLLETVAGVTMLFIIYFIGTSFMKKGCVSPFCKKE